MKKITLVKILVFFFDFLAFYLALYLALWIRKWGRGEFLLFKNFFQTFIFVFLFLELLLFIFDFFHFNEKKGEENIKRFFWHFLFVGFLFELAFFYLNPKVKFAPKLILVLHFFFFSLFVLLLRLILIFGIKEKIEGKISFEELSKENLKDFQKKPGIFYLVSKRIFDLIFATLGLFIFALTFPFIGLFIKLTSRGPIFFLQKRVGKDRKIFLSFKYRTMHAHKEKEEKELWREKDKNEITLAGFFLRTTHLDELPQILNILKGDLSFVGPRPEWEKLAKIFEKEIPYYFLRYQVKPGLTGWAQINYPPSTSIEEAKEKFKYDLYYLKERSFFFDLSIFLRSLKKIFG